MKSEIAIIRLESTLNAPERRNLQKRVDMALSQKRFLILDVSPLTDIDSKGLAELFAVVAKTIQKQGDTAIIGASPQLRAIFSLVRLDQVAEICDELAAATYLLKAPEEERPVEEQPWIAVSKCMA